MTSPGRIMVGSPGPPTVKACKWETSDDSAANGAGLRQTLGTSDTFAHYCCCDRAVFAAHHPTLLPGPTYPLLICHNNTSALPCTRAATQRLPLEACCASSGRQTRSLTCLRRVRRQTDRQAILLHCHCWADDPPSAAARSYRSSSHCDCCCRCLSCSVARLHCGGVCLTTQANDLPLPPPPPTVRTSTLLLRRLLRDNLPPTPAPCAGNSPLIFPSWYFAQCSIQSDK